MAEAVELSTTTQEGPGLNPSGDKEFSDGICKYLPCLGLSFVIIPNCVFRHFNNARVMANSLDCVQYSGTWHCFQQEQFGASADAQPRPLTAHLTHEIMYTLLLLTVNTNVSFTQGRSKNTRLNYIHSSPFLPLLLPFHFPHFCSLSSLFLHPDPFPSPQSTPFHSQRTWATAVKQSN